MAPRLFPSTEMATIRQRRRPTKHTLARRHSRPRRPRRRSIRAIDHARRRPTATRQCGDRIVGDDDDDLEERGVVVLYNGGEHVKDDDNDNDIEHWYYEPINTAMTDIHDYDDNQ
jgi:hypothetical protein